MVANSQSLSSRHSYQHPTQQLIVSSKVFLKIRVNNFFSLLQFEWFHIAALYFAVHLFLIVKISETIMAHNDFEKWAPLL